LVSGKTLIATKLAELLQARKPKVKSAPELLDKYFGNTEKAVRDLFAEADAEYQKVGDESALHVIILDEMDAVFKNRGSQYVIEKCILV